MRIPQPTPAQVTRRDKACVPRRRACAGPFPSLAQPETRRAPATLGYKAAARRASAARAGTSSTLAARNAVIRRPRPRLAQHRPPPSQHQARSSRGHRRNHRDCAHHARSCTIRACLSHSTAQCGSTRYQVLGHGRTRPRRLADTRSARSLGGRNGRSPPGLRHSPIARRSNQDAAPRSGAGLDLPGALPSRSAVGESLFIVAVYGTGEEIIES